MELQPFVWFGLGTIDHGLVGFAGPAGPAGPTLGTTAADTAGATHASVAATVRAQTPAARRGWARNGGRYDRNSLFPRIREKLADADRRTLWAHRVPQ